MSRENIFNKIRDTKIPKKKYSFFKKEDNLISRIDNENNKEDRVEISIFAMDIISFIYTVRVLPSNFNLEKEGYVEIDECQFYDILKDIKKDSIFEID